jgi:hypothetical protein
MIKFTKIKKMVLETVRQETGPQRRWPKVLKSKLAQASGSSPLRLDGSCNGQVGGLTL